MPTQKFTRRRFLATSAASTALVAMPHVRGSFAAGKLSIGFWDHWVPGANEASRALVEAWAIQEKVNVKIDYITSQGNRLLLTIAAETGTAWQAMNDARGLLLRHADALSDSKSVIRLLAWTRSLVANPSVNFSYVSISRSRASTARP